MVLNIINIRFQSYYHPKFLLFFSMILLLTSCYKETTPFKQNSTIDDINAEIWKRFIDKNNIFIDYTDLNGNIIFPTLLDYKEGRPNSIGWWTPTENGSMFGGLYMDGAIKRWEHTKKPDDSLKVRNLANGLMLLATVSSVEGFFARGYNGNDGNSYYPLSSDDQASGWFYGMWRYLETNIPTSDERVRIQNKIVSAATAIVSKHWLIPAEAPFKVRGSFATFDFRAARMLFTAKICYKITKDSYWNNLYLNAMYETGGNKKQSRLQIIAKGLDSQAESTNTWHNSPSFACLRCLWEMEDDNSIKESYGKGLEATATNALASLKKSSYYPQYDINSFSLNWYPMNKFWKSQTSSAQADSVALAQLADWIIREPRRSTEVIYVREPIFAAWAISLAPDKKVLQSRRNDLMNVFNTYKFNQLYFVYFFPLEAVWWRLNEF